MQEQSTSKRTRRGGAAAPSDASYGGRRSPPSAVALPPLGGWTLERALGGGSVCESWLGRRAGDHAVVRVLRAEVAADERSRAQWLRASWSANRFHHARTVKIIEQSTDPRGSPVIVRHFAKGETLAQAVGRGVVDATFALRLAEQLLDVLEMAHAHGILHAGISPSNVIVTAHGSVRVVDFGHRGEDLIAAARVGPFSAPERRALPASPPSEQADIWSVGACLRFALGPALQNADVAAVVDVATAPHPSERYESAYAMLGDVRRLLSGRKPKLRGAVAPVPSQSLVEASDLGAGARPPSSSGMHGLPREGAPPGGAGEWRGNLLLLVAIALLVGLGTFVLVRERLADAPREVTPAAPGPASAPNHLH
jgi:serine/threonine protein kinase